MDIPKYIYEDRIWYRYLHITGGSGDKGKRYPSGGEYDYCVTYLRPEQFRQIDKCMVIWCKENKVPYGVGSTIQEAYDNYLKAFEASLSAPAVNVTQLTDEELDAEVLRLRKKLGIIPEGKNH